MAYRLAKGALNNDNYRYVVHTTPNMQLVLMSLNPKEDIPLEVHEDTSQFFYIQKGTIDIKVGNEVYRLHSGDSIIVPPNTPHYVVNNSMDVVKLFTIYSPPEHNPDRIDVFKPSS